MVVPIMISGVPFRFQLPEESDLFEELDDENALDVKHLFGLLWVKHVLKLQNPEICLEL